MAGGPLRRSMCRRTTLGRWWRLTNTSSTPATLEGVEPEIEQRRAFDGQHALRSVVRDRPQPASVPAASRNAFIGHPPHDAERAHACVRRIEDSIEPVHVLEPLCVGATESAGVRFGDQPSMLSERDVGENVTGVAEPVLAGNDARAIGAVLTHDDLGELPSAHRHCHRRR